MGTLVWLTASTPTMAARTASSKPFTCPNTALPSLSTPSQNATKLHTTSQGLTLVPFSAQPEPFLTQNTP